ncbi:MAG: hypothetical protein QG670_2142 [Thermoproteota archaeon]|nr:hypothetical protein [Thermoproteota archaeon]
MYESFFSRTISILFLKRFQGMMVHKFYEFTHRIHNMVFDLIKIHASKRPEFPTWQHFLRCFCKTEEQVGQCLIILQAIIDSDNYFPADAWKNIPKSSVGMYTKCLKLLRENGLISKKDSHYTMSRDILISLEKIMDRWKDLVNSVERGEKMYLK